MWLASTAGGHVVLFLVTFSIPMGIWSLSNNNWPNPLTSEFAREFLLADVFLGVAAGLAIWNFVTKPIASRLGKLRK
jgi:uncharacterized ion transporter superfamily protein YfcC